MPMHSRLLVATLAAFILALAPGAARAAEVIKIGTLAPAQSPWGQVYKVWQQAVQKKSDGRLELQFFYNGQQGDEATMVTKMKSGQIDAAALTSVGLSKIYRPILVLQIPGLFRSWDKLDTARAALAPEFEKAFAGAGFTLGGWGDVGMVHGFTSGFAIRTPEDLRGKKPFHWRDDSIGPTVYQVIGGVSPVPLSISEVLMALGGGTVNVVNAPCLAAEQLQWASKLDHMSEDATVMAIGAMVFSSRRLDALPADLLTILKDTGKVAAGALSARIRREDLAAFERLKGKMTVVSLTRDEKEKWAVVFRETARRLAQGTFPPELLERVVKLAR